MHNGALREIVEDFLYAEAALLDEWRLDEWWNLFTEDGTYVIPATDEPDGDPSKTLCLLSDDVVRLRWRTKQLLGKNVWAEHPRSRTRRFITNVRIRRQQSDTLMVTANFLVSRSRLEQVHTYVGRYEYTLVFTENILKIRARRAILDLAALRPHGTLCFIL